jgi:UPF0755 protein
MRKIIALIGYFIIAVLVIFLYLDYQAGKPVSSSLESKVFVIEKGQSLKEIGENLEKEGFIKDKNIFIFYSFLKNLRKNFLPGEYELKKNYSLKEIIKILTSPPEEKKITIIEGLNLNEIASLFEKEILVKKEDFLTAANDINFWRQKYEFLKDERIKNLEGFIFPDTYRFYLKTNPKEIIFKILNNFERKVYNEIKEEITKQNKTVFEVITLASIVEKEVATEEDRKMVADIFLRRLKNNIPLQADSTINYITGKNVRRASLKDIKIDSPYNTYKYKGLPPGPISNPGLISIKAVLYPQKNQYWYFLNLEDGTTIYSQTFKEHQENKIKYLKSSFKKEWLVKYKNDEKIYKFVFDSKMTIEEIKKELEKNKKIEVIEPNYIYHASFIPSDPYFSEAWYFKKIGAEKAWDIVFGGKEEITIALIDSGVDINHPDLKDNIWINSKEIPNDGIDNDGNGFIDDINGWDFVENKPDPTPKFFPSWTISGMNHGTVIAGLSSASLNNQGVVGLAFKTKIMPIRVLNNRGEGTLENVIKGIDYAIKNKADIINLSFVGPNYSQLLFETIKRAWENNIFIVAAAGNNSERNGDDLDEKPLYPICLDKDYKENIIIGVTATDENDKKAYFANYGSKCVDISAPGTRIYSTLFYFPSKKEFDQYYGGYWSGTSLATPLVAATAALIKSISPSISNREIRNIIFETAENIDSINENFKGKLGRGRLNTFKAIETIYKNLVFSPHYAYIITSPGAGSPPLIQIFKPNGLKITEFYAYDKNFRGGVNICSADLDGDGIKEILTIPREGGGPHLKIFTHNGELINHFFVYDEKFRNGVNISAGDLNGDKLDEIVVAPFKGNFPLRVLDRNGKIISEFYPYGKDFKGGISLTTADLNGDGIKEIITAPLSSYQPLIRVFNLFGALKDEFLAYSNNFYGGLNISSGDLNNDGLDEIVVSIASSASPYVRIFDSSFYLRSQFLAYDRKFLKGVYLSIEDLDGDKRKEIITVPFKGGGPHVRIFNYEGELKGQFFAYNKNFNKGMSVTIIKKFE